MGIGGLIVLLIILVAVFRVDEGAPIFRVRNPLLVILVIIIILWLVSGFGFTPWWGWGPRF